ncbi:MAG: tRNA glutamyl-Q(34) synthetase GluQRS [Beijerinckiaceae bacterium]
MTAVPAPVFRFAPSPNGYLHLGHALSAILNAQAARATGGQFLLRLEDIDKARAKPEWIEAIFEDLAWLGLTWATPVRQQSSHIHEYQVALASLKAQSVVYPCRCSRSDITRAVAQKEMQTGKAWPRDPDGAPLYPGTCKGAAADDIRNTHQPLAWRLDMTKALRRTGPDLQWQENPLHGIPRIWHADPALWGDVVLARKEFPASYHLAVVHDDALQGVTHVIRGADLQQATAVHIIIQKLLSYPTPSYWHHPLIKDSAGIKLSKSTHATALRTLRQQGVKPQDIREMVFSAIGGSVF